MTAWSTGPLRALVCIAATASTGWSLAPAAAPAAAVQPVDDVKKELDELVAAYEADNEAYLSASRELRAKFTAEKDEAKKKELQRELEALGAKAPGSKYLERFEALAKKAKGSEVALDAWLRVLQLDRMPQGGADRPAARAVAALVEDHLGSERIAEAISAIPAAQPRPAALETLKTIRAKSAHRPVQAAALLALAGQLDDKRSPDADKNKAKAAYAELGQEFGDLADRRGRSYAQIADGYLFEYDRLQVGMEAPDFEAIDENGQKFKLSDYRGKVVLLDFWGIW